MKKGVDRMSDDCLEQMKRMCEGIRDKLNGFRDGLVYDKETDEMVEMPEDCEDCERYLSLFDYLLGDNLGIKVTTDLRGETMYSCEICVAWGGPNIYIDTGTETVEGYWWTDRCSVPLDREICEMIDDTVDEYRQY